MFLKKRGFKDLGAENEAAFVFINRKTNTAIKNNWISFFNHAEHEKNKIKFNEIRKLCVPTIIHTIGENTILIQKSAKIPNWRLKKTKFDYDNLCQNALKINGTLDGHEGNVGYFRGKLLLFDF